MQVLRCLAAFGLMFVGALLLVCATSDSAVAAPYCGDITAEYYCAPCDPAGVVLEWRGSCATLDREWRCVWDHCQPSPWIPCTCPGQSGGCDCLLAGTPIKLPDGTTKPVEAIQVGDLVLSFDQATGTMTETEVVVVHKPFMADHYYVINDILRVTQTHPFLSRGRWVDAMNLQVGDVIAGDGSARTIFSIKKVEEAAMAYNFQVANGTYLAAGMIVHNKPICENFIQHPEP